MSEEKDKNTPPKETPPKEEPIEPQKIKVSVTRDKEVDSLHEELERVKTELKTAKDANEVDKQKLLDDKKRIEDELKEKKAILEQQALAALEKEKSDILELAKNGKLSDEQMNEIEAKLEKPQNVGLVKDFVTMLVSATATPPPKEKEPPKVAPSGKAPITPPSSGGDEFTTGREIIDDIYRKIQYPKQYTKEEVEEAKKKRDQLLTSMIKGKSWEQLRAGQRLSPFKIRNCPNCVGTIVGEVPETCPYCKFKLSKTGDIRPEEQRR